MSTIVSDADGYANIDHAYLYISPDHSTNLVRFDWSQSSGLFSAGLGSSYCTLNTTTSTASGAGNSITLYWVFTVTVNWQEGYMDWGNRAIDDQAKDSGTNWNDIDTWHPDGFWLYDLDVYWTAESTYLEDGDYVQVSENLNVTGYVYWDQITTVYDLGLGTPSADLYANGVDTTDTDTIDGAGYFEIAYTTPASEDWTWSLDIQIDGLPTGLEEGISNDNGKDPLFLVNTSPTTTFGASGDTVSISIQPANIVPQEVTGFTRTGVPFDELYSAMHMMLTNDGSEASWAWSATTTCYVTLLFETPYWNVANYLTYDVIKTVGAGVGTITLIDFHPSNYIVATSTSSISGAHALTDTNWYNGKLEIKASLSITQSTYAYIKIDQLVIVFNSFTETQVTERVLNGTQVIDIVRFESKASDTTFSITEIPTTYSYIDIYGGEADVVEDIENTGSIVISDTGVGTYEVWLDTGMTWHEVAFSPTLPDGLSVDWQIFEWYMNNTHMNKMPYAFNHGYYELLVKDGFGNPILSTNLTILSTDDRDLMYGIDDLGVFPLYYLEIPNNDNVNYDLKFVRGTTAWFPLTALFHTSNIRVYGIETGIDYDVYIYPSGETSWTSKITISMPDHAYVYDAIDLVDDEILIDFGQFNYQDETCYYTIRTKDGGASVYIVEGGGPKAGTDTGLSENTAFNWDASETTGKHYVNITLTKSGYANMALNYTYDVIETSLIIEVFDGVKWVSDSYVQTVIKTNWGDCLITITEESPSGTVTVYTAAAEGTIRWDGDNAGHEVTVTILVDGTTQSKTLTDRYSYTREQTFPTGIESIVSGLEPSDLIAPMLLMFVGYAAISRFQTKSALKAQEKDVWEYQELRKKGVTRKEDLHPMDETRLEEKKQKRFGKRDKVKRQ